MTRRRKFQYTGKAFCDVIAHTALGKGFQLVYPARVFVAMAFEQQQADARRAGLGIAGISCAALQQELQLLAAAKRVIDDNQCIDERRPVRKMIVAYQCAQRVSAQKAGVPTGAQLLLGEMKSEACLAGAAVGGDHHPAQRLGAVAQRL